ncbi:hypothetical protein JTE90_006629 [Oedothorax gibbosus]|uniref:Uncharacterized protein n=1 Tax=Oedothorax gibbosus TaxID=931172 RepID=A0AAV6U812_9ARAC|nr:hypothetical protein JTE90_006629 [Oedothorax gibbosus]
MAEKQLRSLGKSISDRRVMEFRIECRDFLKSLTIPLLEKGPLQFSIIRNFRCLIPNLMATDPETCNKSFKLCVNALSDAGKLKSKDCDAILWQYKEFSNDVAKVSSDFLNFDQSKRLDELFHQYLTFPHSYSWGNKECGYDQGSTAECPLCQAKVHDVP